MNSSLSGGAARGSHMAGKAPSGSVTWASLLRGINVGGHKKIRMAELRTVYESLGFEAVRSYIQSGNVVFRTGKGAASPLARRIEGAIADAFGFDVPVILRTADEMAAVVRDNPFLAEGVDPSKLHVTFLAEAASAQAGADFAAYRVEPDELRLVGREAYLHCPEGMARTKLTPAFLERALGSASTTRNWRTVNAVLETARNI
jgi:uncharacterized protein (DUF1697 family)